MKPYFSEDWPQIVAWVVTLFSWRLVESGVDIKSYGRLRKAARAHDRGSRWVLVGLAMPGILLGLLVAYLVPATTLPAPFFWLGIVVMWVGLALRLYAIAMLGAYFTTTVAVAPGQTVIETGPYRLIRHPSYSGFLLTLLGFGLSLTNWLSLPIILGFALLGIGYRIRVEERVLQEQLGQPYRDYMRRTKRLIPFLL